MNCCFCNVEMGKKRIVKKRITKKKQVKKQLKPEDNAKKDVSNMSRLEYQQAMMDPRFRAAMMGFNNPMPGLNQQMNRELHEKENKNNELTKQITLQADMANLKQKNLELKNQLANDKLTYKDEITKKQAELENMKKQNEIESLQKQQEYMNEKHVQDVEIEKLRIQNSQYYNNSFFPYESSNE